MRELAEKLIAAEAASRSLTDADVTDALRVFEKLRTSLGRFAGAAGLAALTRRALALAREEVPLLRSLSVETDGTITGLESLSTLADDGGKEATLALTTNLLALLITFIGEPLTLRLIKNAWPDAALDH